MSKTYLFAGASSTIAQATAAILRAENEVKIIGLTTQNTVLDYCDATYSVAEYSKNSLPDLEDGFDGLVYFPGTINLRPFSRIAETDFLEEYKINALGAVAIVQKYLANLKKTEHPSVVFISTVAVAQGMPFHASISMAKAALEGLTRALAAEFAPTIRFNCVAPSLTATPLAEKLTNSPEKIDAGNKRHPLKRIGQPDDIAHAIHFLLTEKSSWMTGQILNVDGGMSTIL